MRQMEHVILPGATVGVLGGGQLGKMIALAGISMGYRFYTLDPAADCPCSQVADHHIATNYDDPAGMRVLSEQCQVVTYEFENVDPDTVAQLENQVYLPQGSKLLQITRNRIAEKTTLQSFQLPVAPFVEMRYRHSVTPEMRFLQLKDAVEVLGLPVVMKTATGGYDGKGQWVLRVEQDLESVREVFTELRYQEIDFIVEKFVEFECEISVIVARSPRGEVEVFPAAENIHVDNILHMSIVPARIDDGSRKRAQDIAKQLADKLQLVGVLAIEMFYQKDGTIVINELAPRPHNSGHYTMDACETSQFEQHMRAICNLPLGNTTLQTPVVMVNLLGQHMEGFLQAMPFLSKNIKAHLYGKNRVVPQRKMGHLNIVADDISQALALAESLSFLQ